MEPVATRDDINAVDVHDFLHDDQPFYVEPHHRDLVAHPGLVVDTSPPPPAAVQLGLPGSVDRRADRLVVKYQLAPKSAQGLGEQCHGQIMAVFAEGAALVGVATWTVDAQGQLQPQKPLQATLCDFPRAGVLRCLLSVPGMGVDLELASNTLVVSNKLRCSLVLC